MGLWVCVCVWYYVVVAKKFAPEPIVFLERFLVGCCEGEEKKGKGGEKKEGFVPVGVVEEGLVGFLKGGMGKKKGKKGKGAEKVKEFVKLVFGLVRKFSLAYSHFDCYPSLFTGFCFFIILIIFYFSFLIFFSKQESKLLWKGSKKLLNYPKISPKKLLMSLFVVLLFPILFLSFSFLLSFSYPPFHSELSKTFLPEETRVSNPSTCTKSSLLLCLLTSQLLSKSLFFLPISIIFSCSFFLFFSPLQLPLGQGLRPQQGESGNEEAPEKAHKGTEVIFFDYYYNDYYFYLYSLNLNEF